jgi:hypothetical protein
LHSEKLIRLVMSLWWKVSVRSHMASEWPLRTIGMGCMISSAVEGDVLITRLCGKLSLHGTRRALYEIWIQLLHLLTQLNNCFRRLWIRPQYISTQVPYRIHSHQRGKFSDEFVHLKRSSYCWVRRFIKKLARRSAGALT